MFCKKNFFLLILSSTQSFCYPMARTSKLAQGLQCRTQILIFKRIPFVALISDRGDWSSPLGWEKKIFGWIAVRRAIPAEKENTSESHIRLRK